MPEVTTRASHEHLDQQAIQQTDLLKEEIVDEGSQFRRIVMTGRDIREQNKEKDVLKTNLKNLTHSTSNMKKASERPMSFCIAFLIDPDSCIGGPLSAQVAALMAQIDAAERRAKSIAVVHASRTVFESCCHIASIDCGWRNSISPKNQTS
ncbi:hypothetical protein O181_001820 [Austropuccinia psidii MF-1]|uniref:Uncharacterized protein n=1 Tax=Austropuccinia psidii MF-1 TaxID=1389203 RepID=A0A9Q3BBU7_9BASI|nr:hypothetical protein [Austropuccinia psidii MF-1]